MAGTGTAAAKKNVPELTIKPSGKGYVVSDAKGHEMFLTPLGNITSDTVSEFINVLRSALRAYVNK